jgi:hypothetical protein
MDHKGAKAEAKAAKARAKALRPWYQKKRFILLIFVLVVVVVAAVVGANSGKKTTGSSSPPSTSVPTGCSQIAGAFSELRTQGFVGVRTRLYATHHLEAVRILCR